jgi:hypothetical protein
MRLALVVPGKGLGANNVSAMTAGLYCMDQVACGDQPRSHISPEHGSIYRHQADRHEPVVTAHEQDHLLPLADDNGPSFSLSQ